MKEKSIKEQPQKGQPQEEQPQILELLRRFFSYCRAVLRSPYTHLLLVLLCLIMIWFCFFSMNRLYTKLNERIQEEAERNAAHMVMMENRLLERTKTAEQTILAALADSSEETLHEIRRLNVTYQGLLDSQRRRTLESFYNEDVLAAERREAAAAFAAGRYVTASRLYGEIAAAHPEDHEARFYQYYALFLNNRMDRDNYRSIREALDLLERHGYTRREITETMNFIDTENVTGEEQP